MRHVEIVLFVLGLSFVGCAPHADRSTPAGTLATITKALNDGDSATFFSSLSETYRGNFARNNSLHRTMDTLRGSRISTDLISVDTDGAVAKVTFAAHVHGPKVNADADRVVMQFYKEGDEWKSGAIMSVNGHEWMPDHN